MHSDDDDAVEAALRRAVELLDPLPASLHPRAVAAHALRTMDDELARLTYDSLAASPHVRAGGGARLLAYECGGTTVEIEIVPSGATSAIVGRLVPPRPAEVSVEFGVEFGGLAGSGAGGRGGARSAAVPVDALGRFSCGRVSRGPFRLRCRMEDSVVTTEWTGMG